MRVGQSLTERLASGGRGLTVLGLTLVTVVFLGLPLVALVTRTAEEVRDRGEIGDTTWRILRQALGLSLTTSLIALGLVLAFGTPLAYLLARKRFPGAIV